MGIKLLILNLVITLTTIAQGQFGLGLNFGAGGILTKTFAVQSPQNTFTALPYVKGGQLKVNLFYIGKKNFFEAAFEKNNFFLSAQDKSKNVLFFPELNDGRGASINNGGIGFTYSISYGRIVNLNKWRFSIAASAFLLQLRQDYENYGGIALGDLDSNSNYLWQWRFTEWGEPTYHNKLRSVGLGVSPKLGYRIIKGLYINLEAEMMFGFNKVIEKNYRTQFISSLEPEKNIFYDNSIFSRGSSIKILMGISYEIDWRKSKSTHD